MNNKTKNTLRDYSFGSTFGEFRDFIFVLTLLALRVIYFPSERSVQNLPLAAKGRRGS